MFWESKVLRNKKFWEESLFLRSQLLGIKYFGKLKIWGSKTFEDHHFCGINFFVGQVLLWVEIVCGSKYLRGKNCWGFKLWEGQNFKECPFLGPRFLGGQHFEGSTFLGPQFFGGSTCFVGNSFGGNIFGVQHIWESTVLGSLVSQFSGGLRIHILEGQIFGVVNFFVGKFCGSEFVERSTFLWGNNPIINFS